MRNNIEIPSRASFPLSYPSAQVLAWSLEAAASSTLFEFWTSEPRSGVWSIALAKSSPDVTVTAIDWEAVLTVTREMANNFSVGDRFTFVAGDLHDVEFGKGYDVAVLGHVLHSEGEKKSRSLLKKAFDALEAGGTIVIAEFLVDADRSGPLLGLMFAVSMVVNTNEGDTFSFEDIPGWLEEIGFSNPRLLDNPGVSPLILATRP